MNWIIPSSLSSSNKVSLVSTIVAVVTVIATTTAIVKYNKMYQNNNNSSSKKKNDKNVDEQSKDESNGDWYRRSLSISSTSTCSTEPHSNFSPRNNNNRNTKRPNPKKRSTNNNPTTSNTNNNYTIDNNDTINDESDNNNNNSDSDNNNTNDDGSSSSSSLTIHPIGVVKSIYRLCVGTPRQGLLVSHSRGRIELLYLSNDAAIECVDGLQDYSHIWIIFIFHLNTTSKSNTSSSLPTTTKSKNSSSSTSSTTTTATIFDNTPSKIAPPALGGIKKVGVLATRSPHRYNPIGISLVKLDKIRTIRKYVVGKKKPMSIVCLDISGLDLVDGTPVIDIKPYVASYDSPPLPILSISSSSVSCSSSSYSSVPSWVSEGLQTKRTVVISQRAQQQIERIIENNPYALEFYRPPESYTQIISNILQCINEILSMDVRSTYQTKKLRNGKFRVEQSERYQQTIIVSSSKSNSTNTATTKSSATVTKQYPPTNLVVDTTAPNDVGTNDVPKTIECSTTNNNTNNSAQEFDAMKHEAMVLKNGDSDTILHDNINTTTSALLVCTQQIDNLLIHYTVQESTDTNRNESMGSGAEDTVIVQSIELIIHQQVD